MNAIWERLATRAAELGRPVDEVGRHHVLEGVVRRLARLPNSAGFVLRGSMLTRAWVAPGRRLAQDLDFVSDFPYDIPDTARRFAPALSGEGVEDGVCLEPTSLRARGLWPGTAFPGVRLSLRAGMGAADLEIQVDVGFNDPLVPPPYLLDYPGVLPPCFQIRAVKPETAVGWKLHGLAEMGPRGWRPKDLHDIYLIVSACALSDPDLGEALESAFLSRGYLLSDAEGVFTRAGWWETKSARVKWAEYRQQSEAEDIPEDLAGLVRRVYERLRPALPGHTEREK